MNLFGLSAQNVQVIFNILLGATTAYIAYQQYQTNRFKVRMDLYDRRLKIYEETRKTLRQITGDANISVSNLYEFYGSTAETDFLFGPEIREYLDDIFKHGNQLRAANAQYRDATQQVPPGYDHNRITKIMKDELDWFIQQHKVAKDKFARYLSLGNIKGRA